MTGLTTKLLLQDRDFCDADVDLAQRMYPAADLLPSLGKPIVEAATFTFFSPLFKDYKRMDGLCKNSSSCC